jgi:hypothetical protein
MAILRRPSQRAREVACAAETVCGWHQGNLPRGRVAPESVRHRPIDSRSRCLRRPPVSGSGRWRGRIRASRSQAAQSVGWNARATKPNREEISGTARRNGNSPQFRLLGTQQSGRSAVLSASWRAVADNSGGPGPRGRSRPAESSLLIASPPSCHPSDTTVAMPSRLSL